MPRSAPSQTIEHRLSLSNFERQQFEALAQSYKQNSIARSTGLVLQGVGVMATGVGLYLGMKYIGSTWATIEGKFAEVNSGIEVSRSRFILKASNWFLETFAGMDKRPYYERGAGDIV